jgi:uridylate kinase
METRESIVISLGGSIVVPDMPDPDFIIAFRDLILKHVQKGKRFFIIVGGGKTARRYQEALRNTIDPTNEDLDWIGIYSTHLNAQLVRLSFGAHAPSDIVTDPAIVPSLSQEVIIGAGWKPGCSTDMDAVLTAEEINAKKLINLSNVSYVYDSDPKKNPNAKKFENLSWHDYRSFIPEEWVSGMNSPFDPIASKKAEELGLEVAFIAGQDLASLENYLNGESFTGSVIR